MDLKTDLSDYDLYDLVDNNYIKNLYKPPREANFVYNENSIPLGAIRQGGVHTGEIFCIELKDANRGLFLGKTGAGKTFFLRGFQDRLSKVRYAILNLSDVKNEMASSNMPVQKKFQKNLLAGEEPCSMPTVVLRPTFFRKVDDNLPKFNYWYSPILSDMEYTDFMTILRIDDKSTSASQKDAAQAIFNVIKQNPSKYKTFEDFAKVIDINNDLKDEQKRAFTLRIKNLFDSGFFQTGSDIVHDPLEFTSQGFNVCFNLENYELFAKSGSGFPQVLLSMAFRTYVKERRASTNKQKGKNMARLFVFVDEGNSFAPKNKEPSSKVELMDSVKRDRRYGIYEYFAYQTWEDIPETVITQSEYCFLPYNVDIKDMAAAFESFNTGMRIDSQRNNNLRNIIKQCKKHDWIVLRRGHTGHTIITPLAPMSMHMEMSK